LRKFFIKQQDRIFFGTDFQVWNKLILGSSGDDERPTDHDGVVFFQKTYRFFETADRDWAHMTPIQGKWTISSINIPVEVQRKVYFDNARRLLAKSLPAPVLKAKRVAADFMPDGKLDDAAWEGAEPARIEYGLKDAMARPELSTCVRALWSDKYLYLAFESPYTELTMAESPDLTKERFGLWEGDVVEFFVAGDLKKPKAYEEFEWAPNGERLDIKLDLPEKDFDWQSGMDSAVTIDRDKKIWRVETRIPLKAIADEAPKVGAKWRANLFRHDTAAKVFTAWNPSLTETTHTPERFGVLEFAE
jgi:hypothetical protein